jgi:hypothetical protein
MAQRLQMYFFGNQSSEKYHEIRDLLRSKNFFEPIQCQTSAKEWPLFVFVWRTSTDGYSLRYKCHVKVMSDIETSLSSLEPLIGPLGSNRDFQPAFPNASFQSFPGRGQDLEFVLTDIFGKYAGVTMNNFGISSTKKSRNGRS